VVEIVPGVEFISLSLKIMGMINGSTSGPMIMFPEF
jgi:hypothetical protein